MREQTHHKVNRRSDHQQETSDAIEPLLRNEYEEPASDLYVEAALAKAGLLRILESTGVLPTVHNSNPHDPIADAVQHDQWWRDNDEDAKKFQRALRKRTQALRRIYIGALVADSAKLFR